MAFAPFRSGLTGLLAGWKFLLSLRKRDWQFEDYPVFVCRLRERTRKPGKSTEWKLPAWHARIVRWPISGTGDTPQIAIENLRESFDYTRRRQHTLPRPGLRLPVALSSQGRIAADADLTREFLMLILRTGPVALTAESSLWDFTLSASLDEYHERIRSLYNVDVSDIADGNIACILERIIAVRHIHQTGNINLIA